MRVLMGKGGSNMMMMMSNGSAKGKGSMMSKGSSSTIMMLSNGKGKGGYMMKQMMMAMSKGKGGAPYTPVTQVDLGNVRPEGVTAGPGSILYTSELFYGGVKAVDVLTGEVSQVVPSFGYFERNSLGLWYAYDTIFVAGGGIKFGVTPAIHVYSAMDGSEVITCNPEEAAFLNDLIVYDGYLYVTDSVMPLVFVFDVAALLDGHCQYHTIPLPDSFSGEGFPYANGIEVYKDGLIIANIAGSTPDAGFEMWYIDLESGDQSLLVSDNAADGLLVIDDILYGVLPIFNSVDVYHLDYSKHGGVTAELIDTLTSDLFRTPTTVAPYKGMLYLVNARFDIGAPADGEGDLSTFPETFDLVGLPAYEH